MRPVDPQASPTIPTVDRWAVYVLAEMLRSPDVRAKRRALARIDPLARSAVAHRVESALDDARFDATEADEAHCIRIASLELLHRVPPNPHDMAEVEAAYAALPAIARRRPFWTRTFGLSLVFVALGLGAAIYEALRPEPYAALVDRSPESSAAFERGGRPRHDPIVREALARDLPALSIAASRFIMEGVPYERELARLERSLTAAELVRAIGPFPADALRALVRTYADYVRGRSDEPSVRAAAKRFDDALVTAGLGYRVEVYRLRSSVLALSTHSIERVRLHRVGGRSIRGLATERLDSLTIEMPAMGHLIDGEDTIVVPIDQADRLLVAVLLPLLESPPALTLIDPRIRLERYPWMRPAHASASSLLRRTLVDGRCGASLMRVVTLLEQRGELFGRWSELLAHHGVVLRRPDAYRLDLDTIARRGRIAGERLPRFGELERIDSALGAPETGRAFVCARGLVLDAFTTGLLARIAEHTAPDEPRDPALVALIDPAQQMAPAVFHDEAEVHAIRLRLIELASSGGRVGLPLTLMLRCYTNGGVCDHASEVATVFVFAELARQMSLGSFREPARVDAGGVGAMFVELAQRRPTDLSTAAAGVFARVFGRPVESVR